jgi:hypothetical protein
LTLEFNETQKYVQGANAKRTNGHDDWHVPTKNELNVLFNNRAAIGGLARTRYWSATPEDDRNAWAQLFSNGKQGCGPKDAGSSVRLVR